MRLRSKLPKGLYRIPVVTFTSSHLLTDTKNTVLKNNSSVKLCSNFQNSDFKPSITLRHKPCIDKLDSYNPTKPPTLNPLIQGYSLGYREVGRDKGLHSIDNNSKNISILKLTSGLNKPTTRNYWYHVHNFIATHGHKLINHIDCNTNMIWYNSNNIAYFGFIEAL